MNEPLLTVVGNVAGPPRQRTTPAGVAVADFRIAATPRRLDRATGAWSDGETLWFGVTAWRGLAEHCTASLKKGDRVVVTGRLTTAAGRSREGSGALAWRSTPRASGSTCSAALPRTSRPRPSWSTRTPGCPAASSTRLTGEVLPHQLDEPEEGEPTEESAVAAAA